MSYDKQTWVSGEVITATKLNHMEDGIDSASGGGGGLTVTFTTEDSGMSYTADKTFQEVYTALGDMIPVYGYYGSTENGYQPIHFTGGYYYTDGDGEHGVVFFARTDVFADDSYMEHTEITINYTNAVSFSKTQFALTSY